MNPYIVFSMEERKRIVLANPELKSEIGKVAKLIGASWNKLSDAEKATYKSDKKTKSVKKTQKKTKSDKMTKSEKKNKATPKGTRKVSGYMKFFKSQYPKIKAQNPTFGVTDMAKLIGKSWSALSIKEKAAF